jgi:phosphatidylserine/phosphatidylglycerophosphate/cardiolipin synthase-like enzyme
MLVPQDGRDQAMKVNVCHNGDDVFIAWKPDGFIAKCRGFALYRKRNGTEEVLSTWVGFEKDDAKVGERRASTNWPIQKYQWTDYMAAPGDRLQYKVVAMIGPDKDNLRADAANASSWTKEVTLSPEAEKKIEAYFNRGIVAAQWVSRRLGITDDDLKTKALRKVINTPGDSFRKYLYGPLGDRLFELLKDAAKKKTEIYAALYELDDAELEGALQKIGKRAHVVLANGSVKKKGQDQNSAARKRLKGKIALFNRMISPSALGHNKFLVIEDSRGPRWVWTGSQNWTKTGLCTQANNSVLIDDAVLAREYREQWTRLKNAKNTTPQDLKEANSKGRSLVVGSVKPRLWFTPTIDRVDLNEAKKVILGAKQAILFLMFNPGPADTLLNSIIAKARQGQRGKRLYIRGAINQDPSTSKNPVHLFDQGNIEKADYDVTLPAAIDKATKYFIREMKKLPEAFAMVHSKVVLVDPFGDPVLLTGSHNLGPKASGTNDENLLIIRGAPGLAGAYAANIMAIYNQYRWRFRRQLQPVNKRWKGLKDNDAWQTGYLKPGSPALREINFWVGA